MILSFNDILLVFSHFYGVSSLDILTAVKDRGNIHLAESSQYFLQDFVFSSS